MEFRAVFAGGRSGKRWISIAFFAVFSAAGSLAPAIGVAAKLPTIGALSPDRSGLYGGTPLRAGLAQRGWVEGKNYALVSRNADGQLDRLPGLAAELVGLEVDVIVTGGTSAISAARAATKSIPIVMVASADPVALGFAQTLKRPGGNVTGLSVPGGNLIAKQVQLLKEAVPKASSIALLFRSGNPSNAALWKAAVAGASGLDVKLVQFFAGGPEDFKATFVKIKASGARAVMVVEDSVFNSHASELVEQASAKHIPAMYGNNLFPQRGGLMAYALDYSDLAQRSAVYVDRILKGADPATLPIEQANKFDLVISLQAARSLGIAIPKSLLNRANRIIE